MNNDYLFGHPGILVARSSADVAALIALTLMVCLAITLIKRRAGRDLSIYYPDLAWLRAGIYFCGCWLISAATGVLPTLMQGISPTLGLMWGCALIAMLSFEYIAYYRVWAVGTKTLDRKKYPLAILAFGLLWGLAEGQLFLSFFALAEKLNLGPLWAAVICYFAIGAYYGPWHRFYWDFQVAPEHNIAEWNVKKVVFVHTPNIIFSLAFLVYFKDPLSFIALQCFCLIGACYTMHFPSPRDKISQRPIVDTYLS